MRRGVTFTKAIYRGASRVGTQARSPSTKARLCRPVQPAHRCTAVARVQSLSGLEVVRLDPSR